MAPLASQTWAPDASLTPGGRAEALELAGPERGRLWLGFMAARVGVGSVLLGLQAVQSAMGHAVTPTTWAVAGIYLGLTLWARWRGPWPGGGAGKAWLAPVAVDGLTFLILQLAQPSALNYAPLLALPVLMSAVLGGLRSALASAAALTLLLLTAALLEGGLTSPATLQAALTGLGCFVVAALANQLAGQLNRLEHSARRDRAAERLQRQVNALVIDTLSDGVLVARTDGQVQALNPAARALLGLPAAQPGQPLPHLAHEPRWAALWRSLCEPAPSPEVIRLDAPGLSSRRVQVRVLRPPGADSAALQVAFLQDLQALDERVRTEKLAALGRLSAAVAHEIRNPLAAIVQAQALLAEELDAPLHRRLGQIVQQNAQRLQATVSDVLELSNDIRDGQPALCTPIALPAALAALADEWIVQHPADAARLRLDLSQAPPWVCFDAEHLRRVWVNLLTNASRHAIDQPGAIVVLASPADKGQALWRVWSAGPALPADVERHLFEPFHSSQSRSSGLGLYICRQLCLRHGARIAYRRIDADTPAGVQPGNAFDVCLPLPSPPA